MANIFTAFKIAGNLSKITAVVSTVYTVLDKVLALVSFVDNEAANTPAATKISKYTPIITSTIITIKNVIAKVGPIIGFTPPSVAAQGTETVDSAKDALNDALKQLNELVK
jgi:hypothetical protein